MRIRFSGLFIAGAVVAASIAGCNAIIGNDTHTLEECAASGGCSPDGGGDTQVPPTDGSVHDTGTPDTGVHDTGTGDGDAQVVQESGAGDASDAQSGDSGDAAEAGATSPTAPTGALARGADAGPLRCLRRQANHSNMR